MIVPVACQLEHIATDEVQIATDKVRLVDDFKSNASGLGAKPGQRWPGAAAWRSGQFGQVSGVRRTHVTVAFAAMPESTRPCLTH